MEKFPRVLIVTLGRINLADNMNNGLLLRNLFSGWPRENLAQVYSSGDNGDRGFFGHYYQIGQEDRRVGSLFYHHKSSFSNGGKDKYIHGKHTENSNSIGKKFNQLLREHVFKSGLYELIFLPKLSKRLRGWVKNQKPDIVFAQGYNIAFTLLPLLISEYLNIPVVYYTTDDWPKNRYLTGFFSCLPRKMVKHYSDKLVSTSTVRIAFNQYMQEEYLSRYKKHFSVLMHGDSIDRYKEKKKIRHAQQNEIWIVSTGVFTTSRTPLLQDLDKACGSLVNKGYTVKATIFPVNDMHEFSNAMAQMKNIEFKPCPPHDMLAGILKGADILFLPERFDHSAKGIQASISSKAHLFMYSGTPIIVYSDPVTGLARYAKEEGWAKVVDQHDFHLLADAIEIIIEDQKFAQSLVCTAYRVAHKNHNLASIQQAFLNLINSGISRFSSKFS